MAKKSLVIFAITIMMAGCAKYMIVPPAINLLDFDSVGLVTFAVKNAKGELDLMATQSFLQQVTQAQRVPIVELGNPGEILARIEETAMNIDAAKAIGEEFGVSAFFVGNVEISKVKPEVSIVGQVGIRTKFDMMVDGRLISTVNGATLWTDSVVSEGTTGFFSIGAGDIPYFGMKDKNEAMINLLRRMMFDLTWDFRPTRQRVK